MGEQRGPHSRRNTSERAPEPRRTNPQTHGPTPYRCATVSHMTTNRAARRRNAQNKLPKNLTDQNLDTVIVMRAAAEGAVVLLQGMADLLDAMPTENDEDRTVIEEFKKAANTTTAILSMSLIQ